MKGEKIIVPKKKREEIMKLLHNNHMGVQSTLRRARDIMFWPGMNSEIKDKIEKCDTCSTYQKKLAKQPI